MGSPVGAAIDQASGDLFVADTAEGKVLTFAPVSRSSPSAGYTLESTHPVSGSFGFPYAVALDNSCYLQKLTSGECASFEASTDPSNGAVYVVDDSHGGSVLKFIGPGKPGAGEPGTPATLEAIPAPNAPLEEPDGVAVDPVNGDVYVSNSRPGLVDVFSPSGVFLSQFPVGSGLGALAFNSTGSDLYVIAGEEAKEYEPSGSFVRVVDAGPEASVVAVDPSTNDVYVVHRGPNGAVSVYEETLLGPIGLSGFETKIEVPFGIAVDGATHTVFVSSYSGGVVEAWESVTLPDVVTGPPKNLTPTSVTLTGTINPDSETLAASYQFECSDGFSAPVSPVNVGTGTEPIPVTANLAGLTPNTAYYCRLVGGNTGSSALSEGGLVPITTPSPPVVAEESFSGVAATTVILSALVDPVGSATSYHFEYGTSSSYGTAVPVPDASAGAGDSNLEVSHLVDGLTPNTVYHFRVVAENEYGMTASVDETFTTFAASLPGLPDSRAYEMVTPPANENANVYVPQANIENGNKEGMVTQQLFQAAFSGNAVAYVTDPTSGGAGTQGAGDGDEHFARRSAAGGWTQRNINPNTSAAYQGFASDLSVGILDWCITGSPPRETYDTLYSHDLESANYAALSFTAAELLRPPNGFGAFGVPSGRQTCLSTKTLGPVAYAGANAGAPAVPALTHILFEANEALTPDAVDGGAKRNNLYDSVGGRLHLVNVPPGETKGTAGATFGGPRVVEDEFESPDFSHVISTDGSRIFWTDLNTGGLYVRENDAQPQSLLAPTTAGTGELTSGSSTVTSLVSAVGTGTFTAPTGTATLTAGSPAVTSLVSAAGTGELTSGSTEVISLATTTGEFVVGQPVSGTGIPAGTTITSVSASTLTLSASATVSGDQALSSEGPAPFAVGQTISAPGIPAGTTIIAVGAGTLTLSTDATGSGSAVALSAFSSEVTSVATTTGEFVVGQPVSGTGIPAHTTITKVSGATLTLSAPVTASGTEVPISSEGPQPFAVGQPITGAGIPPETTITDVAPGALTLSAEATASATGVALKAGGNCTVSTDACTVQLDGALGGGGRFWTANADGSKTFFTNGSLYVYDFGAPKAERLTDLTPGVGVRGVIGSSEDGDYVYYVDGAYNLYLRHYNGSEWEAPVFIAMLSPEDEAKVGEFAGNGEFGDWQPGLGHRTASVSPDGRSVVFMSRRSLTGYPSGSLSEVYVFDSHANRLNCVSCNPSGETPEPLTGGHTVAAFLPVGYNNTYQPRWVSEGGGRVFFDSVEPLVSQDTNGKLDVYEWERAGVGSCPPGRSNGCVYLLSGGTSSYASWLLDASASGDDVFIITRAQLASQDRNQNYDVYDVSSDGPRRISPPACSGTACQGVPPAPPTFATPSSVTFNGIGNFPPPPPPKPQTAAERRAANLAKALKACRGKHNKRRRAACEAQARKRYGAKSKKAKNGGRGSAPR